MLAGMRVSLVKVVVLVVVLSACGGSPFSSAGDRSSNWINERKVTTTTLPSVDAPRFVESTALLWSNDGIDDSGAVDQAGVIAAVFERRQGDRFIQASRDEILIAVPNLVFPARAPFGAEWVSSQLVVENSGVLSAEPSAAFGIWSAEPYTRSRTVAQMVVLRVANDPETAEALSQPGADVSCATFAESITDECSLITLGGRNVWELSSSSGNTLVWFDGPYRYELFGRPFVPLDVLEEMAADTVALVELTGP
jgi:hypothetical protein